MPLWSKYHFHVDLRIRRKTTERSLSRYNPIKEGDWKTRRHNPPILLPNHVKRCRTTCFTAGPGEYFAGQPYKELHYQTLCANACSKICSTETYARRKRESHGNGLIERSGGRPTLLHPSVIEAFIWIKDLRRSHCSRFKCFHYGALFSLWRISIYRRMGMSYFFLRPRSDMHLHCSRWMLQRVLLVVATFRRVALMRDGN